MTGRVHKKIEWFKKTKNKKKKKKHKIAYCLGVPLFVLLDMVAAYKAYKVNLPLGLTTASSRVD